MKCYIIAQVVDNFKRLCGYKLFDADSGDTMIVNTESLKKVLSKDKSLVKNAALINNTITGTNGKLDRYAKIDTNGNLIQGEKSPLVVINKIGDLGYTVVDFKGQLVKMPNEKAVEYAKNQGIANGKVVVQDNVEFISSITDSYDVINIAPSKVGNNVKINIPIRMGTDTTSIAKHTADDIQTEMEYNDVFQAMTPEQRSVLKQYYTWYTVDAYKKLAKNVRLSLAPGKAEKLAQLRGIDKWMFAGINDSYMEGNFKAHCELGHRLRYEYFAIPEDALDEMGEVRTRDKVGYMRARRDTVKDLREAGAIVFGETCAGDFFNIAPEDMKKLVKTRKTMSDEIELMSDILTNHLEFNFTKKYELLTQVINKLGSAEKVVDAFGEKVGFTMLAFMKAKMPFPMSLVILAGDEVRKDNNVFWCKVFPEYKNIISEGLEAYKKSLTDALDVAFATQGIGYLIDYISKYSIEGYYQYNPLDLYDKFEKRTDLGRYNKETRTERSLIIDNIRLATGTLVDKIDLDMLTKYLEVVKKSKEVSEYLEQVYINTSLSSKYKTIGDFVYSIQHLISRYRKNEATTVDINSSGSIKIEFTEYDITNMTYVISTLAFNKKVMKANDRLNTRHSRGATFKKANILSYNTRIVSWSDIHEIHEFVNNIVDIRKYVDNTLFKLINNCDEYTKRDRYVSIIVRDTNKNYDIDKYIVAKLDYITFDEMNKNMIREDSTYAINTNQVSENDSILLYVRDIRQVMEIEQSDYSSRLYSIERNRNNAQIQKDIEEKQRKEREEEIARLAEEQRRKEEEASKREQENEAKLDKLRELINSHKGDLNTYGIKTAQAILDSGLKYDKMSSKQKWRIDTTIKELEELKNSETIDYELDNIGNDSSYESNNSADSKIKEQSDIEAKQIVDKVEENTDNNKKEKTSLEEDLEFKKIVEKLISDVNIKSETNGNIRFAAQVALTIKNRTGEFTEKQRKYVMKGYEELTK